MSTDDTCVLCRAEGPDKRTLAMRCFYEMREVVPEFPAPDQDGDGLYKLRICKSCRGRLLTHMMAWADECRANRGKAMDHDGNLEPEGGRGIAVRVNGAIQWLTMEEWQQRFGVSR